MNLAVFFLSITPAFLVLMLIFVHQPKIYQKDLGMYTLKLVVCCLITMRIANTANTEMFKETDLSLYSLDENLLIITAVAGIGFNEEMAKLIPILIVLYISDRWKVKQDVYFSCIFVGAFFAAFENLYMRQYSSHLSSLLIRSLIAVPAHLSMACFMSYFVFMMLKCSIKEDFVEQRLKTSMICWLLQFVIFVKFAVYFMHRETLKTSKNEKIFLIGSLIFASVLLIEVVILMINFNRFKWLLGWNLRFCYALLAIMIPALLHGLHDWGCSRFTGTELRHFYFCLLFTYFSIILYTYFMLNKQAEVTMKSTPELARG